MKKYTKLDEEGNPLPDAATGWSMVRDNITGLTWEIKTSDDSIHDKTKIYNWEDAINIGIASMNTMVFGGFSDWRLPTSKELESLVDRDTYDPAINYYLFPNTVSSYYWSSTTYANNTNKAWCVGFYDGYVSNCHKSYTRYVRAVRAVRGEKNE